MKNSRFHCCSFKNLKALYECGCWFLLLLLLIFIFFFERATILKADFHLLFNYLSYFVKNALLQKSEKKNKHNKNSAEGHLIFSHEVSQLE